MSCDSSEQGELMREDMVSDTDLTVRAPQLKRRLVIGGALLIGLASALLLRNAFTPCVPALDDSSVISLAAEDDASNLGSLDLQSNRARDATKEWLELAHEAAHSKLDKPAAAKFDAVERAMKTEDPEKAAKVVDRAVKKSSRDLLTKRKDLKKFIDALSDKTKFGRKSKHKSYKNTVGYKAKVASCVFDAFGITTSVARLALNIQDATKTCHGVTMKGVMSFNNSRAIHTKVCSVNAFAVLGGVIGMATSIASAANDCATTTSIPNVDAMCSAAVTGLVQALAGVGGAATLINAACVPKGWYHNVDPGTKPSNVGSNERWANRVEPVGPGPARRLREVEHAPPRQLLFGGGEESTQGHCALEVTNVMWSLASAALAINAASHKGHEDCPPVNAITGSKHPPKTNNPILGLGYRIPQALCTVDVFSSIIGFLGAISFLELVAVQCTDIINLQAICASGITGMTAAMAGIGQASTGLYLACDIAQLPVVHGALMGVRAVDQVSGGQISDAIGGKSNAPNLPFDLTFERRLAERKAELKDQMQVLDELKDELMRTFNSPEEVFMHLGYNFTDTSASWRKSEDPEHVDIEGLASLVEEPTTKQAEGGLFGSSATCK